MQKHLKALILIGIGVLIAFPIFSISYVTMGLYVESSILRPVS